MTTPLNGAGAVRPPNAIDFWRGFALATILINHIPGIYLYWFTPTSVSISDAADLFVFIAGWALRSVADRPKPTAASIPRKLAKRSLQIYAVQVASVFAGLALVPLASHLLHHPEWLGWHTFPVFFDHPVSATIGIFLLTYQPNYFDILPLYVVLVLFGIAYVALDRRRPNWVLPVAIGIYCISLGFRLIPPTWPNPGTWMFNPLAWQLTYALGFVLARPSGIGGWVRENIVALRIAAIPLLVFGILFARMHWFAGLAVESADRSLLLGLSKTYAAPLRLLQFLALVALGSLLYPAIARLVPQLNRFLTLLGRNSLSVFTAGILLSLAGQFVRDAVGGGYVIDTIMAAVGLSLSGRVAMIAERSKADRSDARTGPP